MASGSSSMLHAAIVICALLVGSLGLAGLVYAAGDGKVPEAVGGEPQQVAQEVSWTSPGWRPLLGAYPVAWQHQSDVLQIIVKGPRADLYLMPAPTLRAATSAYFALTGAPKVLPRYAYGFMASRWGWDRPDVPGESVPHYVWRTLELFRNGSFPIDSLIADFEWYTLTPDYMLPAKGQRAGGFDIVREGSWCGGSEPFARKMSASSPGWEGTTAACQALCANATRCAYFLFKDSPGLAADDRYDCALFESCNAFVPYADVVQPWEVRIHKKQSQFTDFWFSPRMFPHPEAQIRQYRDELNIRFAGIRKPRMGDADVLQMARENDWVLSGHQVDGTGRNLNYTVAAVRDWYARQQRPLLDAGVEYWWNDEGETAYFTYHYWNQAQAQTLAGFAPGKRLFTINRAFTPGLSRLGASVWTGDVTSTWLDLRRTPGYMLKWMLAGAAHVTCDTGGFHGEATPLLLSRWYQVAAFMPLMRVHSHADYTPHFPFLFGAEAAASMRASLDLRYRLISYHYSLAHLAYETGVPMMRSLELEGLADSVYAADLTSQWFDGPSLLVAPVLSADNRSQVYVPRGKWYVWGSGTQHSGPLNLTLSDVPLDKVPVFAKAGSIVPLAPLVQYTDALPGGALEVHVYAGADASFPLVEDDGETEGYTAGLLRRTVLTWSDAQSTLSWEVHGDFTNAQTFTQLRLVLFANGLQRRESAVVSIGRSGSIRM